ncbi:hypothetical protein ACOTCG_10530 [Achromobacter xylosoxidans]
MTKSTGESSLRPWNELFLLCRRESDRVGVRDGGFPYIVANPPPRVDAQRSPDGTTPYQHLLQQIKGASHDVAALMVERDVGFDERTASSLSLPTVKACLRHVEFWSGQSLGQDWPVLQGHDGQARIAPEREARSPGPFDWIQAMVQKKIVEVYARLPVDADLSTKQAAVIELSHEVEMLPESLGGEYAEVVRQLFRLEAARLAFARTLGASGFSCFERMSNPLRDGYRLLMDGDDGRRCNPALYEDERGYMAAMMAAFSLMLEKVRAKRPLDGELFEQYHGDAVAGVHDRKGAPLLANYRDGVAVCYGVDFGEGEEGVTRRAEWEARLDRYPGGEKWSRLQKGMDGLYVMTARQSWTQCREKADQIIRAHYERMSELSGEASDARDQLVRESIAECCLALEQHHLYLDGNLRTIAFLAMNHLLLEAGMLPVVPDDPNHLDVCTVAETARLILIWQERFRDLLDEDAGPDPRVS